MNHQLIIYRYLWVAPHVLLMLVAFVMFRKGLHREFPIFFASLFFEFALFLILYAMYSRMLKLSPWLYQQFDLVGRVGSIALHFGILQELFESPVKHSDNLRQTTARSLRWITAFLVVLASAFIGFNYYNSIGNRLLPPYATVEALNIAQCFLLVLVFLWHRFLGLKMATFVFGITLGMGLTASLEPVIQAWKVSVDGASSRLADYLQMAVYHCTVLIWLYYALAHEKEPPLSAGGQSGGGPTLPDARGSAADMGRLARL